MDLKTRIEDRENRIRELHAELDAIPAQLCAKVTGGRDVPMMDVDRRLHRSALIETLKGWENELLGLYKEDGRTEEEAWTLLRRLSPPLFI